MKNVFLNVFFLGFSIILFSQSAPKVGDVLVINEPNSQNYNHIKFPRLNILAKRGKVANYKSVIGSHVVIKEVIKTDDDTFKVVLKKKDGAAFFGYLKTVKANYNRAIDSKEFAPIN
jgi:hypothetical protein